MNLGAGSATIRYEFVYDACPEPCRGSAGKGGTATLTVNGRKVAEGRLDHTQCCTFSLDDAADVGTDEGTPVSEDYTVEGSKFTGKIQSVTIELKETKTAGGDATAHAMHEASERKLMAD